MSRLRLPPLALVLAICSLPTSGQAHQALESSAQIETTAENLEVTITLAQTYAPALLDPAPAMPLTPGNFHAVRPALLAVAPKVGAATDAVGATIPPARVLVSLTAEGEIRYLFLYPAELRPAGFGMPALATLPRGYFCTLSDQRSTPPGRAILHKDHPLHAFPALP